MFLIQIVKNNGPLSASTNLSINLSKDRRVSRSFSKTQQRYSVVRRVVIEVPTYMPDLLTVIRKVSINSSEYYAHLIVSTDSRGPEFQTSILIQLTLVVQLLMSLTFLLVFNCSTVSVLISLTFSVSYKFKTMLTTLGITSSNYSIKVVVYSYRKGRFEPIRQVYIVKVNVLLVERGIGTQRRANSRRKEVLKQRRCLE